MPRLTKRRVEALRPTAKDYFTWCDATPGFGVRVHPTGRRIFVVQTRVHGRTRRLKLGPFGALTVEQAREQAGEVIRSAARGNDPQLERKKARGAPTVAEMCALYQTAAELGQVLTRFDRPKRPTTVLIDRGRIQRHIVPIIGSIRACDLLKSDVQRMVDQITAGRTAGVFKGNKRGKAVVQGGMGTAARVKELLGGILSWAADRGLISGPNPAWRVKTARGEPRDRVLSATELALLGAAIDNAKPNLRMAASALSLIALSGLRAGEACGLKWNEIDFAGQCLRLKETKTGRSVRPLGARALRLLQNLSRLSDQFCFPSRSGNGSAHLKKQIARIFNEAGLPDARAQTLRRTFASIGDEQGYSEPTVRELLGQARQGVTQRHYIRRTDVALIAAADKIAERIGSALDGGAQSADVVAFPTFTAPPIAIAS